MSKLKEMLMEFQNLEDENEYLKDFARLVDCFFETKNAYDLEYVEQTIINYLSDMKKQQML